MSNLKNAWLTDLDGRGRVFGLTLESSRPEEECLRVWAQSLTFPADPTPERPLRHTLAIRCLTRGASDELHRLLTQWGDDVAP